VEVLPLAHARGYSECGLPWISVVGPDLASGPRRKTRPGREVQPCVDQGGLLPKQTANCQTLLGKITEHFAGDSALNVLMKAAIMSLTVLIALFPLHATAADQSAPPTPANADRSSVKHPVSSPISTAISSGLPKYKQSEANDKSPASPDDAVSLPKFFVYAEKVPAFSERDFYSKEGFAALLRKKYPGASVRGQDPDRIEDSAGPNYAALMYLEDKRLSEMKHFKDFADTLLRVGDAAGSKELNAEIRKTFMRHPDTLIDAMDKSANNGRR
jgi:hypothetical protein